MLSFHVKFVQTDRWTDRQMVQQYALDLLILGHKNFSKISEPCFNPLPCDPDF